MNLSYINVKGKVFALIANECQKTKKIPQLII